MRENVNLDISALPDPERMVLSAVLQDERAVWLALEEVTPVEFADWRNRLVFETVVRLAHQGSPTDPVSVNDALSQVDLKRVGLAFTFEQLNFAPTWVNVGHYARIVHEAAVLRSVRAAASEMLAATEEVTDPMAALANARRILDSADEEAHPDVQTVGEILPQIIDSLDHKPVYHATPWPGLDKHIIGLKPAALHVVAARPGSGKTISALQMALLLAQQGPVAFASLEMRRADLVKRLLAAQANVLVGNVFKSTLSEEDWRRLSVAKDSLSGLPLVIEDQPHKLSSVTQIQAFAKSVQRKHGKLAGLFIDYLQLIPNRDSKKSRWESMTEISRDLKLLAAELDCPIVALAQLNRESEKNSRPPTLSDLRESGSIEQDADVVIMLQRRLAEDGEPGDELDVFVRKCRHGTQGRFPLDWAGKYARLDNPAWGYPSTDHYTERN